MEFKRITMLSGHYGSGKTNVALNLAFKLRESGAEVAVADVDIVNPYFRTKDSEEQLAAAGIDLICSDYANSNVDIPALPSEIYSITDNKDRSVIMDIGGDDRGALALGRLSPEIKRENNYDMLFVINCYRPLTSDVESTLEVMKEIEIAGKIPFTAIVNNSNLGPDTTPEDVLNSLKYAEDIAAATGLTIKYTSVRSDLVDELKDKIPNLLPLTLQTKIC